jgi:hypothetical protein
LPGAWLKSEVCSTIVARLGLGKPLDKVDITVYEGQRTDARGHFYFTSNPCVSSDLIQRLRYGKKPSDPGRELIKVAPIVWKFPRAGTETTVKSSRIPTRRQAH